MKARIFAQSRPVVVALQGIIAVFIGFYVILHRVRIW
jgi:hypothetical protein